ncbi:uncharacterized protein LOC118436293 isoform X2 [Folsomia candida]|uniref:uncharacterized protein LOC118436293 isoform X2 n=1 Tax=Folsomia candida TaxID=158441 RepID=UPI001604CABB|nr:uncharacterized protein LOC118436293 isoform X2 [Folsomia candida]XP_035709946.1 uncharacterized protein LOC118436293 isoform X2 [Folsomia candida]XP_035709948.1 uncharacterized protein LOC118436293 isoform X2 [Folsomia candida]
MVTMPHLRKRDEIDEMEMEQDEEKVFRFCKPDSDEDDDDDTSTRREWRMVESKERYSKPPPTNPTHRYVNRTIQTREFDNNGDPKPVPSWWKITKVLRTEKKMSRKSEDKGDNKLWQLYCKLAREEKEQPMDVGSQTSDKSDKLTPLTPEVITTTHGPLTAAERTKAEDKIKAAGKEGLEVPGTKNRVVYKPPDTRPQSLRPWGLFAILPSGHWICSADPNCVNYNKITMEASPKCNIHKGVDVGFVLGQFTDAKNKKNEVILHVIASFIFTAGDEQGKESIATDALKTQNASTPIGDGRYIKPKGLI